jgi:hypothetical protein
VLDVVVALGPGTLAQQVMNISSIVYSFVPPSAHEPGTRIFTIATTCMFGCGLLFLAAAGRYLSRTARLPRIVPVIVACYYITIGEVACPITANCLGQLTGDMAWRDGAAAGASF